MTAQERAQMDALTGMVDELYAPIRDARAAAEASRTAAIETAARDCVAVDRAVRRFRQRCESGDWPAFEIPASVRRAA